MSRLADLAQLTLSACERQTMHGELCAMLRLIDTQESASRDGVSAPGATTTRSTFPPCSSSGVRPDERQASWPLERVLQNAPEPLHDAFGVPAALPSAAAGPTQR